MNEINNWLKTKTFAHQQFCDLRYLLELKERRGVKISLCFPTLNEEKTIGKSIVVMKSELMDRVPLIDEIAVVDSGSTDKTRVIAEKFGAKTFAAEECLPETGKFRGKGENLWKSLYLLEGDIIVFVDADISNIHPRFAYGLIGPLLHYPDIKFVKAFYNRPFNTPSGVIPSGGGRVTEILIRPLFSQFFPELSGMVQPLSGEYAGYREVLEQIPFPIGYGVETGMLIDIFQKWGLAAMAQANLELRLHRNQPVSSLGKMSFGILQTFWSRLQHYRNMDHVEMKSFILRQMQQQGEEIQMTECEIHENERPPIIELEAYQKKFHRSIQKKRAEKHG